MILLYQLTKFEATSCKFFLDILITSFKCQNLNGKTCKNKKKKKTFFFLFFTIIHYQQTKFEATSCNSSWDILITKFHYGSLKGALLDKGRYSRLKKIQVSYFLMRNTSMKFQKPILNFVQTDRRMDEPKVICPFNFLKVGGIKSKQTTIA